MRNEECKRLRQEFICDLTRLLYDPGSHNRSKMWIWEHFIHPALGIGYQTYLKESKSDVAFDPDRLVRLVAKLDILSERGRLLLDRYHYLHKLPNNKEIDEKLRYLKEEADV